MLFLSSLLIAAAFSIMCGKALRKHPAPFYLAAAVLSIGTVLLANTRISMPAFVQQNVIALFTKGILAAAFWAVIMWTGALPNGSLLMKKLMPQRGQLSIFAAILTLGHAVGFSISMLPRWLKKADALNLAICIVLMLIMIPLTVISVQKIRRKMKAKTWKSVQRWAYLFYALIPVHVIVLNIAKARNGHKDVLLNLMLYLTVFLGYAVCRLRKWYLLKKKPERQFGINAAASCLFLFGTAVFLSTAIPKNAPETVQKQSAEVTEESAHTTAETSVITMITVSKFDAETSANTAKTENEHAETDSTEHTTLTTSEDNSEDTFGADETENNTETPAQNEPAETPETVPAETEPPAPARTYQDGTFTATAYGYDGDITVHVTIQDDTITDITAETEESDDSYFLDAQSVVIPAIIRSQAADVDACSGATYSSNGIMAAVRTALEQARL